jgi:hypothetical protein
LLKFVFFVAPIFTSGFGCNWSVCHHQDTVQVEKKNKGHGELIALIQRVASNAKERKISASGTRYIN